MSPSSRHRAPTPFSRSSWTTGDGTPQREDNGWNPFESIFHRFVQVSEHPTRTNRNGATKNKTETVSASKNKNQHRYKHKNKPPVVVTLFFDGIKKMTVAVLSSCSADEALISTYFQSRVHRGTAYPVSQYYYELEGFIRENLTEIRKSLRHLIPESIVLALGSLEDSDRVQKQQILEDQASQVAVRSPREPSLLEEVFEIVRLNRLNDDLDVLSIYCLGLTCKACYRIAARVARHRLARIRLTLTPLVDGVSLTGYSKFVRRDGASLGNIGTIRQSECGRAVEYEQLDDIALEPAPTAGTFVSSTSTGSYNTFSWKCEEVTLANLHRWYGDLSLPEYIGQKLILKWKMEAGSADASALDGIYTRKKGGGDSDSENDDDGGDQTLNLVTLHLPAETGPPTGSRQWVLSQARVKLNVEESARTQLDDVAVSYAGRVRVEDVHLTFPCLVRAAARQLVPTISQRYIDIQEHRPLLPQEEAYLHLMERASTLK